MSFFFFLDYCSKCSSFVSKTKTTFLLLLIFGKWCITGFWSEGLVKSTDISFLSSCSGPFLFALYGKGLERFLLFPSPPLFLVQSWGFFLNIQTFYRLTSFKTLRFFFFFSFFPITQKNTFSWLSSIHCQLWTLLSCQSSILYKMRTIEQVLAGSPLSTIVLERCGTVPV